MKAESQGGFTHQDKAKEISRCPTDVLDLAGGPIARPEALLPRPIRVVTAPTYPHLIPASTGGKLREEIGVVSPVSNTALVLDYLNGPLPPLCALTLGDLGLSVLSPSQSGVSQSMSPEGCLLNGSHFSRQCIVVLSLYSHGQGIECSCCFTLFNQGLCGLSSSNVFSPHLSAQSPE